MPLLTSLRKLLCCAPREQEEAEAPARQPLPEPVEDRSVEAGRPCQDYVENETEKYWQEIVKAGSLTRPDLQELRAGALPVLGLAQRHRPGWKLNPALNRAHMAVNAMQLHAVKSGWLKHPFTLSEASPNYVEALIQLADDAGWLAREIPLPDHPAPRHPPIHYTIDPATKRPVLTEDSLIRGDYVYNPEDGSRIIQDKYIRPWRGRDAWPSLTDVTSRGWYAYYTFSTDRAGSWDSPWDAFSDRMKITYHWVEPIGGIPRLMRRSDRTVLSTPFGDSVLTGIHFSPYPPLREDILRHRRTRDQMIFNMIRSA